METNLKAIELRDLWGRYKEDGDSGARERLVLAYSPLVKYVAGRMGSGLPAHVEEADLISYGLSGLITAIERFEPERGTQSSERSSSIIEPLMRVIAKVSNLIRRSGSKRSIAVIRPPRP